MKIFKLLCVLGLVAFVFWMNKAVILFDFNSSMLSGTPSNTASATDEASGLVVTLTTSSGALGSTVVSGGSAIDWSGTSASFDTVALGSLMGDVTVFDHSWKTFISSGGKASNLTLTLSGLAAGERYQLAVITGCPFEGAEGSGNSMTTANSYESATPGFGEPTIPVRTPIGYTLHNVVANERGEIVLTIHGSGSHTPVFNALAVSESRGPVSVSASVGLLGLASLVMKRHNV